MKVLHVPEHKRMGEKKLLPSYATTTILPIHATAALLTLSDIHRVRRSALQAGRGAVVTMTRPQRPRRMQGVASWVEVQQLSEFRGDRLAQDGREVDKT